MWHLHPIRTYIFFIMCTCLEPTGGNFASYSPNLGARSIVVHPKHEHGYGTPPVLPHGHH